MIIKTLAERILLQALEDLWDDDQRSEAVQFFRRESFILCAEMADMHVYDQVRLLTLVSDIMREERKKTQVIIKKRHQNITAPSTASA